MNRFRILSCAALVAFAARGALGGDVRFTKAPSAAAMGANVRITFTVSAPTDVEVAVLDADGEVVRHLAAGAIVTADAKAAPPLTAGTLTQSLVWDRRDDLGRPAVDGTYRIRVRLGMGVAFGRVIGHDPYVVGTMRGVATDGRGNVYVMSQSYRAGDGKSAGPKYIQVFDREGKYARTLMPYSNRLARARVAGFGLVDTGGPITPRNYEGVWPGIYPPVGVRLHSVAGDGRIVLRSGDRLYFLDRDGGAPGGFRGVPLWPAAKPKFHYNRSGPTFVALSPDGKRAHIAGPYVNPMKANAAMKAAWPKGRVYVLDLEKGGGAKPFVDIPMTRDRDLDVPAAMKRLRRAPHGPVHGVAVGPNGNVYVCDRANDRVAIYTPTGKVKRMNPVRQPHLVAVHPQSGETCVISVRPMGYRLFDTRLHVFASPRASRVSASMKLPDGCGRPILALDPSTKHTALWLTNVQGHEVWRVERIGAALKVTRKLPLKSGGALWGADRIAVDYETDDLYVNDGWSSLARYNGLTGKGGILGDARALTGVWERDTNQRRNLSATDATVGPDGIVYLRNGPRYSGPITRWDRGLKPAPVHATGSHVFTTYIYSRYGAGYGERGLAVHPDGRVFVMSMYNWAKYFVHVYAPDGTPLNQGRLDGQAKAYRDHAVRSGLIGPLTGRCGGIRVDAAGNVYLGMQMLPDGFTPPKGFEKDPAYRRLTGSVFKFRPTGGGLVSSKGKATGPNGIRIGRSFVEGAVAVYPDFAPFSGGHGSGCACRNPRFDLDPYGRLYIPNAVRCSVAVVDNAGNAILRFGRYGNADDPGKGEDIPLGWPIGVGISRKHIYVSDMLNKRVIRADVSYAETATADVPRAEPVGIAYGLDVAVANLSVRAAWVEANGAKVLRRRGAAALAALEKAFTKPKANRRAIKDVAAWIRTDQAAKLFLPADPKLGAKHRPKLLRRVQRALTRQTGLPSAVDACVALAHLTRVVPSGDLLRGGLDRFIAHDSKRVRLSALWAADRPDLPEANDATIKLASRGLQDEDERVRVLAAILLFDRASGEGLDRIFAGAMSKQPWVLDQARPYVQESVVMRRGPQALRYPVGAKQVDQVLKLLDDPHNNMRAMAAAILMYSGDRRAATALGRRLGREKISFVRRRLMLGLEHLKSRGATAALLADVAQGPGPRKKGTGWRAAGCLADTGDPQAVRPLIDLLDRPNAKPLALFALSRAFDGSVTTASEYRLIPGAAGRMVKHSIHKLPPDEEIKNAWAAFWKANKAKYTWDGKKHPFRP